MYVLSINTYCSALPTIPRKTAYHLQYSLFYVMICGINHLCIMYIFFVLFLHSLYICNVVYDYDYYTLIQYTVQHNTVRTVYVHNIITFRTSQEESD
jgi:hypothetical protein